MKHPQIIHLINGDSGIQTQADCSWPFSTTQNFCVWVEKEAFSIIPFNLSDKLYLWIGLERLMIYGQAIPFILLYAYMSSHSQISSSLPKVIQVVCQDTGSKVKVCGSSTGTFFIFGPLSCDGLWETWICQRLWKAFIDLSIPHEFCHSVEKLKLVNSGRLLKTTEVI